MEGLSIMEGTYGHWRNTSKMSLKEQILPEFSTALHLNIPFFWFFWSMSCNLGEIIFKISGVLGEGIAQW